MRVSHPCKGLTKAQRAAFERIATNQPAGASPSTLRTLHVNGLIDYSVETVGADVLGEIQVMHWFVPPPIHAHWCEWCAGQAA